MNVRNIITTAAFAALLTAGSAAAQTGTTSTSTPGTPNTGSGGNASANMLMLSGSAAIALGGVALLLARKRDA